MKNNEPRGCIESSDTSMIYFICLKFKAVQIACYVVAGVVFVVVVDVVTLLLLLPLMFVFFVSLSTSESL